MPSVIGMLIPSEQYDNVVLEFLKITRIATAFEGFAAALAVLITGVSQSRQHVLAPSQSGSNYDSSLSPPFVSYLRTSTLSSGYPWVDSSPGADGSWE
ncbi:hypothetical protein Tco_0058514 [Tanacetum coccineum]